MTAPRLGHCRRLLAEDSGELVVLIIGYALVAAALVVVAVDVSALFLAQRGVAGLADGAAVAGAQAVDVDAVYAGGATGTLPLSATAARAAVAGYLGDPAVTTAYPQLQPAAVTSDGVTVDVRLRLDKPLPFLGLVARLTGAFPGGTVPVVAAAHARAPLR